MLRKSSKVPPVEPPKSNRLIDLLPPADRGRILTKLEVVTGKLRQTLYEEGAPIGHVYFPLTGVASLLTVMEDGSSVEVGTIGSEGMVGIPLLLGATTSPGLCIVQVVGPMWRMPAEDFAEEIAHGGAFSEILHRYVQYFFIHVSQGTACNRLHPAEERCARWLLHMRERAGADDFDLTHEFLAQMLGVRRATVTVIAGGLQNAGIIEYSRGHVQILDAERLQDSACECYAKIRAEYERVLGPHPSRPARR